MNLSGIIAGIILLFVGTRFEIGNIAFGFTGSMMFQTAGALTLVMTVFAEIVKNVESHKEENDKK